MRQSLVAVLVLMFVSACGGAGGDIGGKVPPPDPGPTLVEQLETQLAGLNLTDFYAQSYEVLIYREPETIAWNGLEGVYPVDIPILNDLSDVFTRETLEMVQVVLNRLRSFDRSALSDDDKLTYDFYDWYLQDRLDHLEFIYHDFAATYNFAGVQNNTERLFVDILPLATVEDAEDYNERLSGTLRKFRQLINHLNLADGAGIVEPAITMDAAIARLNAIADAPITVEGVSYYERFARDVEDIPGLTEDEREQLRSQCRIAVRANVIPAYQELRTALQNLRARAPAAIGVGQYPQGSEFYNYTLRHHTTTNLTAAQVHQLGLDHLQRIHAEMRQIFDQLGYPQDETLQELFARVATDGGVIPAVDVKATHEAIIDAAELELDQAFDIFPSADVVVEEDPFGGFYIGPSFDGTRPGAFYAGTENPWPWFQLPSLTYHEAVPGHHTQIAIAMEQPGPVFLNVERFTAFVEGWALYAERLAFELGWYENDPYGDLGRLQFEALRAARLVIDTGIHSMGWSFEEAVQFNMDNVGASRGESEGAAGRYSVVPAQATAYTIGMLHILDARQRAMDQLGAEFDLKEFHRVVLTAGGIPLPLLDGVVDTWIAEKLATP
jgi:uncharacterized protein (DUF885 family)